MSRPKTQEPGTAEVRGYATHEISVEHLSVDYTAGSRPVHVLDDISVEIQASEFVCAVGTSGCGKTTFLNVLAGFLPATSGTVMIGGEPCTNRGVRRGYVFQDYSLFPWLTCGQNVSVALKARGVPRSERAGLAAEYLHQVGLETAVNSYPHQLSGGMQQRTAVARALAYDPPVLLFDEPFGALDAFTRERLERLVSELVMQTRKTMVYVTHNIAEAVFLADRVLVFGGKPAKIMSDVRIDLPRPRDEDSAEFVSLAADIKRSVFGVGGSLTI